MVGQIGIPAQRSVVRAGAGIQHQHTSTGLEARCESSPSPSWLTVLDADATHVLALYPCTPPLPPSSFPCVPGRVCGPCRMCAGVQVRRFGVRQGVTDATSAGLAAHLRVQAFRFRYTDTIPTRHTLTARPSSLTSDCCCYTYSPRTVQQIKAGLCALKDEGRRPRRCSLRGCICTLQLAAAYPYT